MAKDLPPRTARIRKRDALARLRNDEDAWVSTAAPDGTPYLVPLSFVWYEQCLLMCTKASNPTAHNLTVNGRCWIALGHTRDVVLVESTAEPLTVDELPDGAGDAFVGKLRWDPRGNPNVVFLRFRPRRVSAWREENELAGRELMRDGVWLV